MKGDASVLGIRPPHSIRVDMDGYAHNWPQEMVEVERDRLIIFDPLHGNRIVTYPYVQAKQVSPGSWQFIGPEDDFLVTPGPPVEPSMDTAGPADDWPYDEQ